MCPYIRFYEILLTYVDVYGCFASVHTVCHISLVSAEAREVRNRVSVCHQLLCKYWESHPGPHEEQAVLLTV